MNARELRKALRGVPWNTPVVAPMGIGGSDIAIRAARLEAMAPVYDDDDNIAWARSEPGYAYVDSVLGRPAEGEPQQVFLIE